MSQELKMFLVEQLDGGEVVLPSLPSVVQALLRDIEAGKDVDKLVAVLRPDPVLSAQVLRLANSSFYSGGGPVRSVQQAMLRIGVVAVRKLALAGAQKPLFAAQGSEFAPLFRALWRHSLATAIAAERIARRLRAPDPDGVFLAGLLHDVGKVAILTVLDRAPRTAEWPPLKVLEAMHTLVVSRLLGGWQIPPDVIAAIEHHHAPGDAGTHVKLASMIHLADAICRRVGLGLSPRDDAPVSPAVLATLKLNEIAVADLEVDLEDRVSELDSIMG